MGDRLSQFQNYIKKKMTIDSENREWIFKALKDSNLRIERQHKLICVLVEALKLKKGTTPQEFQKELDIERINLPI